MVTFPQSSNKVLQILLKKCQTFCPVTSLPTVFGCFIFTTPSQSAKPVDSKLFHMVTAMLKSTGKEEHLTENGVWKGNFSPRPFNVFAAGASKRRSAIQEKLAPRENIVPTEHPVISRKKKLCPPEKPLSSEEWEKLMGEFEGTKKFEELMLEEMIAVNSPMDVAKSLLAAVATRHGDIGYGLLMKYLVLCVSQKQFEEIYEVYDIMKARYKRLETSGYSLLIRGLSGSQHWREASLLLEEIKKVMTPSKGNYGDCIRGALINQDINLACRLFNEMLAKDITPNMDTMQTFFDVGVEVKDDQLKTELIRILSYLRINQVYPDKALMQSIKQWFESIPGENWKGSLTTIKNSGQCPSCNQHLESIDLSPDEYSILKDKIIKDVIQGKDTFRKTTPQDEISASPRYLVPQTCSAILKVSAQEVTLELLSCQYAVHRITHQELEEFQMFVNKRPPFDIVIDGLNVARASYRNNPSQTLLDVILHLAHQNLRVLVLGRKHMLNRSRNWDRNNMAAMQKKANFFYTENVSEDDPFLLYATLHSGHHCRFVTRDLLRDHKACLSDSLTRRLFFKWQRGHQIVLSNYTLGKRIKFEPVLCFDTIVQSTASTWHIPYDDSSLGRSSYEVPTKWLCLQQK